ncbi:MAG: gliding motility-associated C-terminal domain-containing protein, partial [Bacteroidia bacterium]
NLANQNNAVTTARVTANTTYTVQLTDINGCINNASVSVNAIEDLAVEVPLAFSPNGDGINDRFIIRNLDQYPQNTLQVFDRTGKVIYRRENYNNDWNGMVNGKMITRDTYFYILTIKYKVVKKGAITVVL